MLLLIFDGCCRVCTRIVAWIRRRVPPTRLLAVPLQTPGMPALAGRPRVQLEREVWLISTGRERWGGPEAVIRILEEVGGPWRLVARALALPGLYAVLSLSYHAFAPVRGWFGLLGTGPACRNPLYMCRS